MAGPLSYEPSVEAIVSQVLPRTTRVLAGGSALRHRASWAVLARATGLGEIEGGELVLVPPGRVDSILSRLTQLKSAGIAGVIVAGIGESERGRIQGGMLPVIEVPVDTDMRKLQGEIERFIARRRRELFALSQELHRSLTEAAIDGATLEVLLQAACRLTGRTALYDADGDVVQYPPDSPKPVASTLMEARIAVHGSAGGPVHISGPPEALAAPVNAGGDRRGLVLVTETNPSTVDNDEAILSALASACAIVLARIPEVVLPSLDAALQALQSGSGSGDLMTGHITAIALHSGDCSPRQLERALSSELTMRDLPHISGLTRDTLIALVAAGNATPWEQIVASIARRLGATDLCAGIGRTISTDSAGNSCRDALDALAFSSNGETIRFHQIELPALLRASEGWADFARSRLLPLLDGTAAHDDLLKTLRAYLATGRNAKEAARILHVHRNTLAYRLRRLRDLLGADLDDQNTLFEFELAVRAFDAAAAGPTANRAAGSD